MNRVDGLSYRRVAIGLALLIVVGGVALTILSSNQGGRFSTPEAAISSTTGPLANLGSAFSVINGGTTYPTSQSQVVTQVITESVTATMASTTTSLIGRGEIPTPATSANTAPSSSGSTIEGSGSIEYFSNVTMVSSSPPKTTSAVIDVAYMEGGYVAYSSSNANYSFVVIRVPAANFQTALTEIQSLGNVTNTARSSNDVTVQYTDLNATLASLETEQASLLKILNASTTVNTTLAIESQIQLVNQQIDETESQILQTQRLLAYSTISITITISGKSIKPSPLTLKLSTTPKSGVSPLGVTFSAVVQGGSPPYIINYNFGDGTSQEGQIVIHQYYGSGDFNATVTVTDSSGNVAMASAIVHVRSPPSASPLVGFAGTVENLFVSVVEGMTEIAVVVLPIGLVVFVILVPFRRRSRIQKEIKPS